MVGHGKKVLQTDKRRKYTSSSLVFQVYLFSRRSWAWRCLPLFRAKHTKNKAQEIGLYGSSVGSQHQLCPTDKSAKSQPFAFSFLRGFPAVNPVSNHIILAYRMPLLHFPWRCSCWKNGFISISLSLLKIVNSCASVPVENSGMVNVKQDICVSVYITLLTAC